ncbi:MAG: hypothetical protein KKA64_00035 [Nanoarchaeota archaeon]|nr:hypothetical protein [Nanoarchaeota archaeon]
MKTCEIREKAKEIAGAIEREIQEGRLISMIRDYRDQKNNGAPHLKRCGL